ncbi:hypothetical protein evm_006132 [Chilo suppressalis]|nr:hypothetical protein evm_006132 [Chilo suppressalis]
MSMVHAEKRFKKKSSGLIKKGEMQSTVSVKIQKILSQLHDSKMMKDKGSYKNLLRQMKDLYHTTTTGRICARCRA